MGASDNMHVTHYGLMYGIVPIKIDFTDHQCPGIAGRWFGCEMLLSVFDMLFGIFCYVVTWIDPDYDPMFPIRITKIVDPKFHGVEVGE